jgi:hypothetical protein
MRARVLLALITTLTLLGGAVAVFFVIRQAGNTTPYELGHPPPATSSSATPSGGAPANPASGSGATVYLYYYLWWTPNHWRSKLGPAYPVTANPPPLPGHTDSAGCDPVVNYPKATIVDLPNQGLYNQSDPAVFGPQIAEAEAAGITGFLVSWQGTGLPTQTYHSSGYDERLHQMVRAVDLYNQLHPTKPFHLGLAFSAFGDYHRPAAEIVADLSYFTATYGHDPAFENAYSQHPLVVFMDSRKFPVATVAATWTAEHSKAYLVGDETAASWSRDAPYLDASSYYWSSENPLTNRTAGSDVRQLGEEVHEAGKRWFAPFIPGYDDQLVGGSCVPRDGVQTMETVWATNVTSHPDAWFGISWNEFVENTYLEPSLAYGSTYLDELSDLIHDR